MIFLPDRATDGMTAPEAQSWRWYERQYQGGSDRVKARRFDPALGIYSYEPAPVRVTYQPSGDFIKMAYYLVDDQGRQTDLVGGDWIIQPYPGIAPDRFLVETNWQFVEIGGWRVMETLGGRREIRPTQLDLGVSEAL